MNWAVVVLLLGQLQSGGLAAGPGGPAGPWRFHAGDDPVWASPRYDDTGWDSVQVPGRWPDRHGVSYGWYRIHFVVNLTPREPLGIGFRGVADVFDAYVDGVRIGGVGAFPPAYRPRPGIPVVFGLPPAAMTRGDHVIAVRVYAGDGRGGLIDDVDVAPLATLMGAMDARDQLLLATALLLLGIGVYQLFFWVRRLHALEHLYILLCCVALAGFCVTWMPSVKLALEPWIFWYRPFISFGLAALAAFGLAYRHVFEMDEERLIRWISTVFLVLIPVVLVVPALEQLRVLGRWVTYPLTLVWGGVIVFRAMQMVRRGVPHAPPVLWGALILVVTLGHDILADWGFQIIHTRFSWLILVGIVAFFGSLAMTTARKFVDTEMAALYDRLTGLYRREVVMDALAREIQRAGRVQSPLAVIMLDVDRFKVINDTLGHQAGDRVLTEIGRRMMVAGRAVDWLGRYGGEEFIAVLAGTDVPGAVLAADRLRSAVSALPIPTGRTSRTITLSAGVAAFEGRDYPTVEQLVGAADAALYRAKSGGRDRTAT